MSKAWVLSILAAAAASQPEVVRTAIRDHPTFYCCMAVAFALGGGFVVQYGQWLDGKITVKKASSELMFSVLTGVIVFLILAARGFDELFLYLAGLIGGMYGRKSSMFAHNVGIAVAKQLAAKWIGVPLPDDNNLNETPSP